MSSADSSEVSNRRFLYAGIFLVSLAMLLFQVLLTRLFSVIIFYHFAFFSVSLAMFGLSLGAVVVHRYRDVFLVERTALHLHRTANLFGMSAVASAMLLAFSPLNKENLLVYLVFLIIILLVTSVAFGIGGICICLGLTRFPTITNRLYASDLLGAALGSLALYFVLPLMNGPTVAWVVLLFSSLSAWCFAKSGGCGKEGRFAQITIALSVLVLSIELSRPIESSFFALKWVKGSPAARPLYERWNSFSRVTAFNSLSIPYTWGLSDRFSDDFRIEQRELVIDASAATPITKFNGSFEGLDHLKADIVNIVHYLRHDAREFVVGVGGGRDLLTGLLFNQKAIVGAEVNPSILKALGSNFASFSGDLLTQPKITVYNDEARSFIARHDDKYDIIQISLVDTWAASASGAFALAENSLYTVDAWRQFISRLSPGGILSVSRWWKASNTAETLRLISLAKSALVESGIKDPRAHLIVVLNDEPKYKAKQGVGVATLLLGKDAFSEEDLKRVGEISEKFNFRVGLVPSGGSEPLFEEVMNRASEDLGAQLGLRLNAPHDDSPFFFYFSRIQDVLLGRSGDAASASSTMLLLLLVALMGFVSFKALVRPLLRDFEESKIRLLNRPLLIFFAAIGFGFMLVEISQMQWFAVFLGHPTYGITVTLFTILLGTGLGSFLSQYVSPNHTQRALLMVAAIVALWAYLTPTISPLFRDSSIESRISFAVAMLGPLGVCLGMGFPLGMRLVNTIAPNSGALLWAVNGAASVCAGPIAILVAISSSVWGAYWCGVACYFVAFSAYRYAYNKSTII